MGLLDFVKKERTPQALPQEICEVKCKNEVLNKKISLRKDILIEEDEELYSMLLCEYQDWVNLCKEHNIKV